MKKSLLFLFIVFFSCSEMISPERELYECWNKSFAENQIDMESELLKFENDLIKNGYLSDNSWKSYQSLIDSLSQDTFPMITRTISMLEFSQATFQIVKKCSDTALYDQIPKLTTLMDEFVKAQNDKIYPYSLIYRKILETIDNKDFGDKLYKTWIVWILLSNSNYSGWLKEILPQKNNIVDITVLISIDSLTNYYFDDEKVNFSLIEPKLKELKKTNPELKVGLRMNERVTVDKLVEIMNMCLKLKINLVLETSE